MFFPAPCGKQSVVPCDVVSFLEAMSADLIKEVQDQILIAQEEAPGSEKVHVRKRVEAETRLLGGGSGASGCEPGGHRKT